MKQRTRCCQSTGVKVVGMVLAIGLSGTLCLALPKRGSEGSGGAPDRSSPVDLVPGRASLRTPGQAGADRLGELRSQGWDAPMRQGDGASAPVVTLTPKVASPGVSNTAPSLREGTWTVRTFSRTGRLPVPDRTLDPGGSIIMHDGAAQGTVEGLRAPGGESSRESRFRVATAPLSLRQTPVGGRPSGSQGGSVVLGLGSDGSGGAELRAGWGWRVR